jgi:hypothetical protein
VCGAPYIFSSAVAAFGLESPHEAEGGHPMTFIKPLNLLAVGAAFVFLGAIVFGVL